MKRAARLGRRLAYFAADAWDEFRHSPGINLLALGTLAATLFVAGLVELALGNVGRQLDRERQRVQVRVYLKDDVAADAVERLRRDVAALDGVAGVELVTPEEALRRYRGWAARSAALLDELGTNPLPASLEVALAAGPDAERAGEAVAAALAGRPEIDEARFDRDWLRRVEALLEVARLGGTALALVVFAAVIFVMASVLRLAVYARSVEIEIMLLVGATPGFVRGPFLVAGLAQGLLAAGLGLVLVELARRAALAWAGGAAAGLLDLVAASPLSGASSLLLLGIGLAVSLAGAFFAVRGSL